MRLTEDMRHTPKIMVGIRLSEGASEPVYQSAEAAGADVKAFIPSDITLSPGETKLIPTGIVLDIPPGYEIQVRPRSGLALKNSITLLNTPGTIDSDYRGEVGIIMHNAGKNEFVVHNGDRIAQLVLAPVYHCKFKTVNAVSTTERGTGGFGHTGV